MCFNAIASFNVFLISFGLSSFLLYIGIKQNNKNFIINSIISFLISFMQFIEFFIWKNNKCNLFNHYLSLSIITLLFLQPIITGSAYLYLSNIKSNILYFYLSFTMFLYILFFIYLFYYLFTKNICTKTYPNISRLEWGPFKFLRKENNDLNIIFHLFYFFILFFILFIDKIENTKLFNYYAISFLLLLFIIIYLFTFITNKTHSFSSLWCFYAVLYPLICLFFTNL
jgi:hypothetical protein